MNRFPANDPREWLNRARSNLIQAQAVSAGVYLEDLCFQAHQAAEKALKAFCLFRRLRVPRTHNLIELAELLTLNGVAMTDAMRNVIRLNPYAVGARYPGTDEPVDVNEHRQAVEIAQRLVEEIAVQMVEHATDENRR